jgi:prepilin-type N-terminal cleavage/methylation domain-containing protein
LRARRRGFTLVEVALTLALAGLFAFGGMYTVGRLGPKLDLQSGIWEVTSGLNQARFRAILTGASVRVRFDPPGFVSEIRDEASGAWGSSRAVSLRGVQVRANNAPVFHPQGTVSDLATITVSNTRGSYRITVAITGRIRTIRTGRSRPGPAGSSGNRPNGARRGGSSSGSAPSPCWCAGTRRPSRRRSRRRPSGAT